jgi:hypothetical protein
VLDSSPVLATRFKRGTVKSFAENSPSTWPANVLTDSEAIGASIIAPSSFDSSIAGVAVGLVALVGANDVFIYLCSLFLLFLLSR